MPTPSPQDHRPRLRWRWVLLLLVLAVIGGLQLYRFGVHAQVKSELAALEREGYAVDARQLQGRGGKIPDRENAAISILQAGDQLVLEPDAFQRDVWPVGKEPLTEDARENLQFTLTNNAPALEAVHAAARLTKSQFPLDFSLGPNMLLPHLVKIKSLANLLKAETVVRSDDGDVEGAVQSVLAGMALARSLDTEPILISQLVRHASLAITCSALERLLNEHPLSESQLTQLLSAVRGVRASSAGAAEGGYMGETCIGIYCFQASPRQFAEALSQESNVSAWMSVFHPVYAWSGLRDRDFVFYLRRMRETLTASRAPFPEALQKARAVGQEVERSLQANKLLICSGMLLPSLQRAADKAAESEARLCCAEAALCVEIHRRREGKDVPESLAELKASDGMAVPADPIDGAPLRYARLNPGYLLYSIGPDGTDERGRGRGRDQDRARSWPLSGSGSTSTDVKGYDLPFRVQR